MVTLTQERYSHRAIQIIADYTEPHRLQPFTKDLIIESTWFCAPSWKFLCLSDKRQCSMIARMDDPQSEAVSSWRSRADWTFLISSDIGLRHKFPWICKDIAGWVLGLRWPRTCTLNLVAQLQCSQWWWSAHLLWISRHARMKRTWTDCSFITNADHEDSKYAKTYISRIVTLTSCRILRWNMTTSLSSCKAEV